MGMMNYKTVNVLEVNIKYEDIPESLDYVEHFEMHEIPYVCKNRLNEPCNETYNTHRLPVKEIWRNGKIESYYIATPEVQEIIDCDVKVQVENIKADYEHKERVLKTKEEWVNFELEQLRTQMVRLRKSFHKREQSWAKESFIGHLICFASGCAVIAGIILGG